MFGQDELPQFNFSGFATGSRADITDVVKAEFDAAQATVNYNAQRILGEKLFDRVIADVKENYPGYADGELVNPFRAPWYSPEIIASRFDLRDIEPIDRIGGSFRAEKAIFEFNKTLEGIANAQRKEADAVLNKGEVYPYDLIPRFIDFDKEIKNIANDYLMVSADVQRRANAPTQFVGGLVGGAGASFTDPVNLLTSLAPVGGQAKSVLSVAVRGAITNAATEALMQPNVAAWHNELGLDYDFEDAGNAVFSAAVFGGLFEGGSSVLYRSVKRQAKFQQAKSKLAGLDDDHPLKQAMSGSRDDILKAAEALKDQLPPEGRAAKRRLEQEITAEQQRPSGISREDHQSAIAAADRVANGADGALPQWLVRKMAEEPILPPLDGQADIERMGKPVTKTKVRLAQLETDAQTFQYKSEGDSRGVTSRLEGARAWDEQAEEAVFVWERSDGAQFVADGHQRSGLARRLEQEGHAPIRTDAWLYKEADGWSAHQVRGVAAAANIRKGTGDVIDTATAIREFPEILDDPSISLTDAKAREARVLARLSDDVFGMVRNRMIRTDYAATIGRYVPDTSLHKGIAEIILEARPANVEEARFLVRAALESRAVRSVQNSLFGPEEIVTPSLREKMKLTDEVMKAVRRDEKLFSILNTEADRIEGTGGNQLDRAGNRQLAESGALIKDLILKLATRKGDVSDMMNNVVDDILDKKTTRAKGARQVAEQLRQEIDAGRIGELTDRAARISEDEIDTPSKADTPELDPDEPANARALDDKTADMFGEGAALFPSLEGDEFSKNPNAASQAVEKAMSVLDGCVVRSDGKA